MGKRGRPKRGQVPRTSVEQDLNKVDGGTLLKEAPSEIVIGGRAPSEIAISDESPQSTRRRIMRRGEMLVGDCSYRGEDALNWRTVPRAERVSSPYLRAARKGVVPDGEIRSPNPLMGNRDTHRGLQLSNEEEGGGFGVHLGGCG
ncbi:hypothetical protein Dimus_037007 [Dionaea muscipula]